MAAAAAGGSTKSSSAGFDPGKLIYIQFDAGQRCINVRVGLGTLERYKPSWTLDGVGDGVDNIPIRGYIEEWSDTRAEKDKLIEERFAGVFPPSQTTFPLIFIASDPENNRYPVLGQGTPDDPARGVIYEDGTSLHDAVFFYWDLDNMFWELNDTSMCVPKGKQQNEEKIPAPKKRGGQTGGRRYQRRRKRTVKRLGRGRRKKHRTRRRKRRRRPRRRSRRR